MYGAYRDGGGLDYTAILLTLENCGVMRASSVFSTYFDMVVYFLVAFRNAREKDRQGGSPLRKGTKKPIGGKGRKS